MILFMTLNSWKIIQKNLTTVIYGTKQYDEVLDEENDSDADQQADTELEDITVMVFDELTIPG